LAVIYDHASDGRRQLMKQVHQEQGNTAVNYTGGDQRAYSPKTAVDLPLMADIPDRKLQIRSLANTDSAQIKPSKAEQAHTQHNNEITRNHQKNAKKPIDKTRQDQIDNWLKSNSNNFVYGFGGVNYAEPVYEALQGKSELAGLSANEQRYLVNKVADKVTRGQGYGLDNVAGLASLAAKGNPKLRVMVSQCLTQKATTLIHQPPYKNGYISTAQVASSFAENAVMAAGGDKSVLAQVLGDTQPRDGVAFAQVLEASHARLAVLEVLNSAPASPTTSAIVQNLFVGTEPRDITDNPGYAHEMATALAREWFPDADAASTASRKVATARLESIMRTGQGFRLLFSGPTDQRVAALSAIRKHPDITAQTLNDYLGKTVNNPAIVRAMAEQLTPQGIPDRKATIDRMTAILSTRRGRTLFFGSTTGNGNVPAETRNMALQIVLADPSITADTLSTGNVWENTALLVPLAQKDNTPFRDDTPHTYSGKGLENMIGQSMGFQPTIPTNLSKQQVYTELTTNKLSLFSGKDGEAVKKVAEAIRKIGGDGNNSAQVTVLPITYSNAETGTIRLPLYRVQTPKGEQYVDNIGRTYSDFKTWQTENKLPAGKMVFPENGHLIRDGQDGIKLDWSNTPLTIDKPAKVAAKILDYAALTGGIVVGIAAIYGTGGLAIGGIGTASSTWLTYREGSELYDRYHHNQSINPLTDPEARSLWLNVAANVTGMGAFATEATLIRNATAVRQLGQTAAMTIGTGRVAATTTNAAAFTNACVDLYQNWDQMDADQRITMLLQMGFWGVTSAAAGRQARNFNELINPAAAGRAILDNFNPPVQRTNELPGNAVELVRNPTNGDYIIRAGMRATDADIRLHRKIASLKITDQGLQGMVRSMLGEPEPGTAAYLVKMESLKLHERIQQLEAKLADPNLTPQQRTQLEGDIASTYGYLSDILHLSEMAIANPNVIAAPSLGRIHAKKFDGLIEALEQGKYAEKGYYFRMNSLKPENEPPDIVRLEGYDKEHPRLEAYYNEEKKLWDVRPNTQVSQRRSMAEWRETIATDFRIARYPEKIPMTEQALNNVNASAFVRGYVHVHERTFAYLEKHATHIDVAAMVKKVASVKDGSAAHVLRIELRRESVKHISRASTNRMTRLEAVMATLPTNGERGALFTAFRERRMPDGLTVLASKENATTIDGVARRADGVVVAKTEIKLDTNVKIQGKFLAEDKSGANPYVRSQAEGYSNAFKDGKITAKNGDQYEGVLYFFQNEGAAESAVRHMDNNTLNERIHVGFYTENKTIEWIR
jgi:hypothetical protein